MPYLLFSNSSILDISLYPLQISFIVSHVSKQVALLMMMKQEGGSITNHDWVPLDTSIMIVSAENVFNRRDSILRAYIKRRKEKQEVYALCPFMPHASAFIQK